MRNGIKKNKKAQMFTLIAILLLSLLLISFEVYSMVNQRESIQTRISSMNNYLFSVEKNLQRQMYISGFRIIFLAEDQITKTGDYIDVNSFFNEAFFNGTVAGTPNSIMVGATYNDLINSINQKAEKINVNVVMINPSLVISQDDPWNIKLTLVSNFVIEDKSNLARWEKQQITSEYIPIEKFEDPLFIVNTNAKILRKINRTIYQGIYAENTSVINLLDHLNKGYYAANPSAPSFLKRLAGNFSPDSNGIESFVNIPQLSQQGVPTPDKSCVDYIYFSGISPEYQAVSGMPEWFRLDTNHLAFYNVSG